MQAVYELCQKYVIYVHKRLSIGIHHVGVLN